MIAQILSEDYLAGTAPDAWIPLRSPDITVTGTFTFVLIARIVSQCDAEAIHLKTADPIILVHSCWLLAPIL